MKFEKVRTPKKNINPNLSPLPLEKFSMVNLIPGQYVSGNLVSQKSSGE